MPVNIKIENQVCEVVGAEFQDIVERIKKLPGTKSNGKAKFNRESKYWEVTCNLPETRLALAPFVVLAQDNTIEVLTSYITACQHIINSESALIERIIESSTNNNFLPLKNILRYAQTLASMRVEDLYEPQVLTLKHACAALNYKMGGDMIIQTYKGVVSDRDLHVNGKPIIINIATPKEPAILISGCIPYLLQRRLGTTFEQHPGLQHGQTVIKGKKAYADVKILFDWLERMGISWRYLSRWHDIPDNPFSIKSFKQAYQQVFGYQIEGIPNVGAKSAGWSTPPSELCAAVLGGTSNHPQPTDVVFGTSNIKLKNICSHSDFEYNGILTLSNGKMQEVICEPDKWKNINIDNHSNPLWRLVLGEDREYWWCKPMPNNIWNDE